IAADAEVRLGAGGIVEDSKAAARADEDAVNQGDLRNARETRQAAADAVPVRAVVAELRLNVDAEQVVDLHAQAQVDTAVAAADRPRQKAATPRNAEAKARRVDGTVRFARKLRAGFLYGRDLRRLLIGDRVLRGRVLRGRVLGGRHLRRAGVRRL